MSQSGITFNMSPFTRDPNGSLLCEEVWFWEVFTERRRGTSMEREMYVPFPHARFGYEAFFTVRPWTFNGEAQWKLAAKIDLLPRTMFVLPPTAGWMFDDMRVRPSFDPRFNPLWYANERSSRGPYQLKLSIVNGVRVMVVTSFVAAGNEINFYYGPSANPRPYAVFAPTERSVRHQDRVAGVTDGLPWRPYLLYAMQLLEDGHHRRQPALIFPYYNRTHVIVIESSDDDDHVPALEEPELVVAPDRHIDPTPVVQLDDAVPPEPRPEPTPLFPMTREQMRDFAAGEYHPEVIDVNRSHIVNILSRFNGRPPTPPPQRRRLAEYFFVSDSDTE
jgi:hypothetical protein